MLIVNPHQPVGEDGIQICRVHCCTCQICLMKAWLREKDLPDWIDAAGYYRETVRERGRKNGRRRYEW